MKKLRSKTEKPADPVTKMAKDMSERSRGNMDVLTALFHAVTANQMVQQRFRNAVLARLSKIETIVQIIHGAQIVDTHTSEPRFEEKLRAHAEAAENYISQLSDDLVLKMVHYIYGEEQGSHTGGETRLEQSS